jgi:hypothetical protein
MCGPRGCLHAVAGRTRARKEATRKASGGSRVPARTAAAQPQINDISQENAKARTHRGQHSPQPRTSEAKGWLVSIKRPRGLLLCGQAGESPAAVLLPRTHRFTLCNIVQLLLVSHAAPHNSFRGSVSTQPRSGVKRRWPNALSQLARRCAVCVFVERESIQYALWTKSNILTHLHSPDWFGVQGVPVDKLCSSCGVRPFETGVIQQRHEQYTLISTIESRPSAGTSWVVVVDHDAV